MDACKLGPPSDKPQIRADQVCLTQFKIPFTLNECQRARGSLCKNCFFFYASEPGSWLFRHLVLILPEVISWFSAPVKSPGYFVFNSSKLFSRAHNWGLLCDGCPVEDHGCRQRPPR